MVLKDREDDEKQDIQASCGEHETRIFLYLG